MSDLPNRILSKINEIKFSLAQYTGENLGLYAGLTGIGLFYHKLYELTGDDTDQALLWKTISKITDKFSDAEIGDSFANGYTGIAWALNFLGLNQVIEIDADVFFSDIEPHIYAHSLIQLKSGDYDFMYHGLGGALFAIQRLPDEKASAYLTDVVNALDATKVVDAGQRITWIDKTNLVNSQSPCYTLGLSHGVPGVIAILLILYNKGIEKDKVENLIRKSVEWILRCKLSKGEYRSIFPSSIYAERNEMDGESRLAWCHGDLGLAWILSSASIAMNEKTWADESSELIINSLNRTELIKNGVFDAGICHGTAGIAYMFKRLSEITNSNECKLASDFWIQETLKQSIHNNGLAGYKSFDPGYGGTWANKYGLIEGIAGIGLILIEYIKKDKPETKNEWDRCLLLRM